MLIFGCVLNTAGLTSEPVDKENFSKLVYPGENGMLIYKAYTEKGDCLPDFSYVGYMGGESKIPVLPVVEVIEPGDGSDDATRMQMIFDKVSFSPADQDGLRGAILIKKGKYFISRTLYIRGSGVVIRGEGEGEDGTILVATAKRQYDLIQFTGSGKPMEIPDTRQKITNQYVPVGARRFTVEDGSLYKPGDQIVVLRPSTSNWISDLGMDRIPTNRQDVTQWKAGDYNIHYQRNILEVDGNQITIDAPLVCSLDQKYGGGCIYKYEFGGRIEQVGIENIRLESVFTHNTDENHGWRSVSFDAVQDGWVRNITARYFGYSAVHIMRNAKQITVQDSKCLDPVSKITGGRRYSFNIEGQLNLVKNCYARGGRHDFVLGSRVAGPNVFLDCRAENAYSVSEPHHRWSTGTLYDNVSVSGERAALQVTNRGDSGTGHGWAGAQVVFWNCQAPLIAVLQPPTAQNFAIGLRSPQRINRPGVSSNLNFINKQSGNKFIYKGHPFVGDGYFESPEGPVTPRSLYIKQLEDRLGIYDEFTNENNPNEL